MNNNTILEGKNIGELNLLYGEFVKHIMQNNACIKDNKWLDFISFILDEVKDKFIQDLSKGTKLIRGRIYTNYSYIEVDKGIKKIKKMSSNEMGKPSSEFVLNEGRFNKKNESVLYLASDVKTCLCELRPRIDDRLSIISFEMIETLKLFDFQKRADAVQLMTLDFFMNSGNIKFKKEKALNIIWDLICADVSTTVTSIHGSSNVYKLTQCLGRLIQKLDYDGILYKSSVNPDGFNVVVFDDNKVKEIENSQYDTYVHYIEYKTSQNHPTVKKIDKMFDGN